MSRSEKVYPRSDSRYRRRVYEAVRRGGGMEWFRENEGKALEWLNQTFYRGNTPEKERLIVQKYWKIRYEYRKDNDKEKFFGDTAALNDEVERQQIESKNLDRSIEAIRKFFTDGGYIF